MAGCRTVCDAACARLILRSGGDWALALERSAVSISTPATPVNTLFFTCAIQFLCISSNFLNGVRPAGDAIVVESGFTLGF
jgi:hypothetical protein